MEALCTLGWQQAREKNKTNCRQKPMHPTAGASLTEAFEVDVHARGRGLSWLTTRELWWTGSSAYSVARWVSVQLIFGLYGEGGGLSGGGGHFHRWVIWQQSTSSWRTHLPTWWTGGALHRWSCRWFPHLDWNYARSPRRRPRGRRKWPPCPSTCPSLSLHRHLQDIDTVKLEGRTDPSFQHPTEGKNAVNPLV